MGSELCLEDFITKTQLKKKSPFIFYIGVEVELLIAEQSTVLTESFAWNKK